MPPHVKPIRLDLDVTRIPRKRCNIRLARTVINGSLRWKRTCKLELRRKEKQFEATTRRTLPVLKQLLENQENLAPSRAVSEALADQMFDVLKGAQFAPRWCLCDGR